MPAGGIALVRCCLVGGGPAGMMLGFLLARVGLTAWSWKGTATSCATSAGIRSIRPPPR